MEINQFSRCQKSISGVIHQAELGAIENLSTFNIPKGFSYIVVSSISTHDLQKKSC